MLKQFALRAVVASGLCLGTAAAASAQLLDESLNGAPLTISTILLSDPPRVNPGVFGLRANDGDCIRVEGISSSFNGSIRRRAPQDASPSAPSSWTM